MSYRILKKREMSLKLGRLIFSKTPGGKSGGKQSTLLVISAFLSRNRNHGPYIEIYIALYLCPVVQAIQQDARRESNDLIET